MTPRGRGARSVLVVVVLHGTFGGHGAWSFSIWDLRDSTAEVRYNVVTPFVEERCWVWDVGFGVSGPGPRLFWS